MIPPLKMPSHFARIGLGAYSGTCDERGERNGGSMSCALKGGSVCVDEKVMSLALPSGGEGVRLLDVKMSAMHFYK